VSRIIWNDSGQRLFEDGVDRAVLYPNGGAGTGVPWNGLVSVDESPEGGQTTPLHFDGIKYLDQVSGQDYKGTLEAYTYPDEFVFLDGNVQLAPGLYATLQPREMTFGLCYRTTIGNDIMGSNFGYKLHLIYNAMAEPTTKTYKTRTNIAAPDTFKWAINAVAPAATTYKPTAHFIVDSRFVSAAKLKELEDLLYGTDSGVIDGGRPAFVPPGVNGSGGTAARSGPDVYDGGAVAFSTTPATMPTQAAIITLLNAVAA
jgi:hypothetical protein